MLGRLILAAILAATLASAQDEGGAGGGGGGRGGGGGGGDMGGGGGPRVQKLSKLEMFVNKLKLNREQQEDLGKTLTAGVQEAAPIRQKIDSERVNILQALVAGKPANMEPLTGLIADLMNVEAKTFGKVLSELKPNQTKQAGQAFELLADTFEASAGGRGGRGGGGMRGGQGGGGRK